jgi:hypothetical protein
MGYEHFVDSAYRIYNLCAAQPHRHVAIGMNCNNGKWYWERNGPNSLTNTPQTHFPLAWKTTIRAVQVRSMMVTKTRDAPIVAYVW